MPVDVEVTCIGTAEFPHEWEGEEDRPFIIVWVEDKDWNRLEGELAGIDTSNTVAMTLFVNENPAWNHRVTRAYDRAIFIELPCAAIVYRRIAEE